MSTAVLDEPLTLGQESIRRGSGKTFLLVPLTLLIGFFFAVFFSTRSEVEEGAISMRASPMSMSCPRLAPVSVNAVQQSLRKLGVPPSPMEKVALTAYAATRDVSMAAQAKAEFSKLDQETKSKLTKLRKWPARLTWHLWLSFAFAWVGVIGDFHNFSF